MAATAQEYREDKEFSTMLNRLEKTEADALAASLEAHGQISQISVWANPDHGDVPLVLDGHHRLRLLSKLDIEPKIRRLRFPSRDDAREFLLSMNWGRRNMTPTMQRNLIGGAYNRDKQRNEAERAEGKPKRDVSKAIARRFGVGEHEPRKYGKLATHLAMMPRPLRDGVLTEKIKAVIGDVIRFNTLTDAQKAKAAKIYADLKGQSELPCKLSQLMPANKKDDANKEASAQRKIGDADTLIGKLVRKLDEIASAPGVTKKQREAVLAMMTPLDKILGGLAKIGDEITEAAAKAATE